MKKLVWQSFILLLSFAFIFIWQNTPLADFTVPILGLFVFMLLIIMIRKKGFTSIDSIGNSVWSVFAINVLVFLLMFSTGGITSSPLFFLIYFIGFGIAFVFEPLTVFVFIVGAILILIPQILEGDVFGNALRASSIVLIGPLAFFFGREFKEYDEKEVELETMEQEAHDKAALIEKEVVEVLEEEKGKLTPKAEGKLKKILKESDTLREETKLES